MEVGVEDLLEKGRKGLGLVRQILGVCNDRRGSSLFWIQFTGVYRICGM